MIKVFQLKVNLCIFSLLVICATTNSTAAQANDANSLNRWLNDRIKEVVQARIAQRSNTTQTEAPSSSSNSSSLVDQSSASDLIGVGLSLAGLTAGDKEPKASSASATVSVYSILCAIKQVEPLNPIRYRNNALARSFWVTLGYDDEAKVGGGTERAKQVGIKWLFVNRRDPSRPIYNSEYENIEKRLALATKEFGDLSDKLKAFIFGLPYIKREIVAPEFIEFLNGEKSKAQANNRNTAGIVRLIEQAKADLAGLFQFGPDSRVTANWSDQEITYFTDFQNKYFTGGPPDQRLAQSPFGKQDEQLAKRVITDASAWLEKELDNTNPNQFVVLSDAIHSALNKIRRASQFSISLSTKQRPEGVDEYKAELILDKGLTDRLNFTANGAFEYKDRKAIGADTRSASYAAQLQWQLQQEPKTLVGRKPITFILATQGSWSTGMDFVHKHQAKLTFSLADGVDFPISVTYSNRTDLINEQEVKGQFGFTFDVARLIKGAAFKNK